MLLQVEAGNCLQDSAFAPAAKVLWTGVAAECKLEQASAAGTANTQHDDVQYHVISQVRPAAEAPLQSYVHHSACALASRCDLSDDRPDDKQIMMPVLNSHTAGSWGGMLSLLWKCWLFIFQSAFDLLHFLECNAGARPRHRGPCSMALQHRPGEKRPLFFVGLPFHSRILYESYHSMSSDS